MKISIVTLFPKMIEGFIQESILKRAQEKGLVTFEIIYLRDYAKDSYGTVDDRPYGGGAGMVLRSDILYSALCSIPQIPVAKDLSEYKHIRSSHTDQKPHIVITSPRGTRFNQQKAREYAAMQHIVIVAGHYEAIDERIHTLVDEEVSIGDFVLTGGEIVASAIVDSVVRLLPGVLKKEEAAQDESFMEVSIAELIKVVGNDHQLDALQKQGVQTVQLLEYPHYTRPDEFLGMKVPDVLLSGDHKQIQTWKLKQAYQETVKRRPDLLSVR